MPASTRSRSTIGPEFGSCGPSLPRRDGAWFDRCNRSGLVRNLGISSSARSAAATVREDFAAWLHHHAARGGECSRRARFRPADRCRDRPSDAAFKRGNRAGARGRRVSDANWVSALLELPVLTDGKLRKQLWRTEIGARTRGKSEGLECVVVPATLEPFVCSWQGGRSAKRVDQTIPLIDWRRKRIRTLLRKPSVQKS
jgi:hypothetical protein